MNRRDKQALEDRLRGEIWFAHFTAHHVRMRKERRLATLLKYKEAAEQAREQRG